MLEEQQVSQHRKMLSTAQDNSVFASTNYSVASGYDIIRKNMPSDSKHNALINVSSFEDSVIMTEDSNIRLPSVKTRKVNRDRYTTYSMARDTKCKLNRTTNNFGAVTERLGGLIMTPSKRKSVVPDFLSSPRTA